MSRCDRRRSQVLSRTRLLAGLAVGLLPLLAASLPAAALGSEGGKAEPGAPAPDFELKDTEGQAHRLSDYTKEGKIVVLEWFNPDCPFVRKHHVSHKTMSELVAAFGERGVVWLAVNSGAPGKQGAGLERNRDARKDYGISYPVLLDESGKVGRAYGAKTTPHMFVIDAKGVLRYAGGIDDERNTTAIGKVNHVRNALEEVLDGKAISVASAPPYGCSVKYAG